MLDDLKAHFAERLSEPSTWRGIVLLLTVIGAYAVPSRASDIVNAGLALAGGLAVTTPDKPR